MINQLKRTLSLSLILIVSFLPIIFWLRLLPLTTRFSDWNSTTTSLGQIAGLLGVTLFAINLILSGRFKIFDKIFQGLDRMYDLHEKIGAISFSLILFHPLLLVFKYAKISLSSAVLFLLPGQNFANTLGIIGLLSMMLLMILTFYFKVRYNYWKISHKFMTAVFVFAVLHVIFISSDVSRDALLRYYVVTLSFIGLLVGIYRSFLRKYFNHDLEYSVVQVTKLNEKITEIILEPKDIHIDFKPGQFAYFRFHSQEVGTEVHPFSLASENESRTIRLVTKILGDYTSRLPELKPGTTVFIEGPFGYFSKTNYLHNDQIWIAGGIGITPFLSMANSLNKNSARKITLYYCLNNNSESIYLNELNLITQKDDRFKIILWYSDERGHLTADKIKDLSGDLKNKDFFICGPDILAKSIKKQLLNLGVKRRDIHFEKFNWR